MRVVRGESAADVETFYRLHLQTRRRLGVPVQPRRFFALLLERVIRTGLGFVLTAHRDNVPVAGALFCAWNGTVMCKYSARADGFTKIDVRDAFDAAVDFNNDGKICTKPIPASGGSENVIDNTSNH